MKKSTVLSISLGELKTKGTITVAALKESGDMGPNDVIQRIDLEGDNLTITISAETAQQKPIKKAVAKKRSSKKPAAAKKTAPKKAAPKKAAAKKATAKKPAKGTRKGGAKQATIERFLTSKVADLKKVPAPAIEALTKGGITTVAQLLTKSQDELLAVTGFDGEALKALKKVLTYHKQKLARKKVGKKA